MSDKVSGSKGCEVAVNARTRCGRAKFLNVASYNMERKLL